jgi:hypothetical protein
VHADSSLGHKNEGSELGDMYRSRLPIIRASLLACHTHRALVRRRRAATHQPGARREVSHLRPDPATAAEGRGHCCISMATNLCLRCLPRLPLAWKMNALLTVVSERYDLHPIDLACSVQESLQNKLVILSLIYFILK